MVATRYRISILTPRLSAGGQLFRRLHKRREQDCKSHPGKTSLTGCVSGYKTQCRAGDSPDGLLPVQALFIPARLGFSLDCRVMNFEPGFEQFVNGMAGDFSVAAVGQSDMRGQAGVIACN